MDALKSIGEDSSFSNRKLIAEINGISNYSGTAEENIELLNKLKNGKLIKSISSTIITVPTLDTSNPATPSTTIPLTDESITIPISDTDNIKETDAITDDNEIEDKLIYFSKCDSKYNSIEEALKSIYAFSSYEYRVQIGKVNNIPTDDSAKLNMELLKRLKNGNLIRPSLIVPPFQEIYNKEQIDDMIKKLEESKNTNIQKRKKTLVVMAKLLFNFGYESAYVAGILGNINGEGDVGQLESSFYRNITLKPKYLIFMDEEYDYAKKYSGKHIYDNLSLVEIKNLLYELAKGGWKGKFGIGCIQWTGVRSIPLINFYLEEIGFKDKITFEQATSAEAKLIINELNYDKEYNNIYKNWKKENTNIDSENAAYNASIKLTKEYEKPATNKAKERAETAKSIYKIMTS